MTSPDPSGYAPYAEDDLLGRTGASGRVKAAIAAAVVVAVGSLAAVVLIAGAGQGSSGGAATTCVTASGSCPFSGPIAVKCTCGGGAPGSGISQ